MLPILEAPGPKFLIFFVLNFGFAAATAEIHVVGVTFPESGSGIAYDCLVDTGVCTQLFTLPSPGHALDLDYEEIGRTPRGFVLSSEDGNVRYCSWGGTCTQVGTCNGVVARAALLDKDSGSQVNGYFIKCEDSTIHYCKSNVCSEILSGITYTSTVLTMAIERDASGLTTALIVPLGAEVHRCPIVAGVWDSTNCASIASAQSFTDTRGVGVYYDAQGAVAGYYVCSYTGADVLKCPTGEATCEVVSSLSAWCTGIAPVEGDARSPEYFIFTKYSQDPGMVLYDAAGNSEARQWTGTANKWFVGVAGYKVTTSTTTTTPDGAEVRIVPISQTTHDVFHCAYPAATCDTITTVAGDSLFARIHVTEGPGSVPRGLLTNAVDNALYCTMTGSCASVGACPSAARLRGIDFDKDTNGYVRGYYIRCQDNTIHYCKDASCTELLSGSVTSTLGTMRVETAANGETTALLLGEQTKVERCPVSDGTGSASDCENIGGTFGEVRGVAPYYDADGVVKGYIVADNGQKLLRKCWRNVPACEVIASGVSVTQLYPVVVENVDGVPLLYMTNTYNNNPPIFVVDANDYTSTGSFYSGSVGLSIHAYDAYMVTSTTTTTTMSSVHVELMIALGTDLRKCVLASAACEYLALGRGAHHFAIDFDTELWQHPRGILIASTMQHMEYCTMDGTCTEVGSCDAAYSRAVALDKDANNEILGYYLRCTSSVIKYCTVAGSCSELLSGVLTHDGTRISVERTATGETAALLLGDSAEMRRCPVSGGTADAANCERIGGYEASTIFYDVEAYYRADGSVGGYIVADHTNSKVLKCWLNIPACEELATGIAGTLFDVGVVENTDGTPLWFVANRYQNQPSVLFIDANDYSVTEDFADDDASDVIGIVPYLVQVTSTTTTTTSTTSSTTSTSSQTSTTTSSTTVTTSSTSTTTITSTTSSSTTITTTSVTTSTTTSSSTTRSTTSTTTSTSSSITSSTSTSTMSTMSSIATTARTTTMVTTNIMSTTAMAATSLAKTGAATTTIATTTATSTTVSTITWTTATTAASTVASTTAANTTSMTSPSTATSTMSIAWTQVASTTPMSATSTSGSAMSTSMANGWTGTTRGASAVTTFAAAQASIVYCKNDATFTDRYGLTCSDWSGWNCTTTDDVFDQEDLSDIQTACPVSCSLCPEGSVIIEDSTSSSASSSSSSYSPSDSVATTSEVVFQDSAQVSFDLSMDLDVSGIAEKDFLAGVGTSVAAALGVPKSNVQTSFVSEGAGRRLAGGVVVRCQIVVPAGSTTLSVVKAATKIAEEGSEQSNMFKSSFSSSTGLDTSALTMTSSQVKATTVNLAKTTDGTIVDVSEGTSSASSQNNNEGDEEGGEVTLASGCEDAAYVDEQGYGCSAWVGYSCSSSKWLTGEKPYSLVGLLEVQANCILSCGRCSPADRPSADTLKSSCADDEYSTNFCRRWRGMNCAAATNYSFSSNYAATLQKRCPRSCGFCDDQTEPVPCADTPNFLDENNYACEDWAGFSCTKMYTGYTEEGMLLVQAYCQESCNFCTDAHAASKADVDIDECEDDPIFLIDGSFGCDYFVGKSCLYSDLFLNPRWLLGPAASAEWHQALWTHCPVSCGICSPEDRSSDRDLFLECEDDDRLESWCLSSWEGTNCHEWPSAVQLGSESPAERFNATVFGRCPRSCGLCTPPSCGAGTRRNKTEHTCVACSPGEYASSYRSGTEAASCIPARAGFYVNASGSKEESLCDFGTYSSQSGSAWCEGCPAGRFTGSRGSSECEACAPGFYTSEDGSSVCSRCAFGFYEDKAGSTACQACQFTFTTIQMGSTSGEECVCPVGTYFDPSVNSCADCPPGFECFGGANYVDNATGLDPTIMLKPGVMSLPDAPLSAYTCIAQEINCPGHRPPGVGDDSPNPVCQGSSRGVRCGYCAAGFHLDVEEGCMECPKISGFSHVLRIVLVLTLLIFCLRRSYLATARDDFPPKVMFWMAVAFLQFLTAVEHLPVNWPNTLVDVWDFCNIFNIFDLVDNFMSVNEECLFGDSVTILMIRDVIKPLAWPVVLFIPANILHRLSTGKNFNWMIVVATIADTLLAVFIQVSVMVVYALPIDEMPNSKLFLSYHPRIERGSDDWKTLLPLTALAVLIYFAGFLAFVAYGLWTLPRLEVEKSEYRHLFAFFGDYRPSMYWWTGVLLAYECLFALANALFDNPYIRIYLTIVFVIVFALLEVAYKPGLTWETQSAAVASQLGMATLLALSTGIQGDETVDKEGHKPAIAALAFTVILLMAVVIVIKLVHELVLQVRAEEKTMQRNIRLLLECRNFMNQHLACDLKTGCLVGVAELDHCQAETLFKFGHLARVGLLGIAPDHQSSTLHTFVDCVLSGNRLAYTRDSRKFGRSSTSAIAKNALNVQMGWSSRRGPGDRQIGSQPADVSSASLNFSNFEESSEQGCIDTSSPDASFHCELSERVDGVPARPMVTLPFRSTQWWSTRAI